MHVDLTPSITLADFQKSAVALINNLRRPAGQEGLDWGCQIKAGAIIVGYASYFAEPTKGLTNCPCDPESVAKMLEHATQQTAGTMHSLNWQVILSTILAFLTSIFGGN